MSQDLFETIQFSFLEGAVTPVDTPYSPGAAWRTLPHWMVAHSEGSEAYIETAEHPKQLVGHNYVAIVPPHTPHRFTCFPGHKSVSRWCHVKYTLEHGLDISAYMTVPLVIGPDDSSTKIGQIIEELAVVSNDAKLSPILRNIRQKHLGFALLREITTSCEVSESLGLNHRDEYRIVHVLKYIDDSISEPIEIGELARLAGLSVSRFSRVFSAIMNMSPIEFVRKTKMNRACEMLVSTDAQVGEIAERVGYRDIYIFSRAFKKQIGMSPLTFRKNSAPQGYPY